MKTAIQKGTYMSQESDDALSSAAFRGPRVAPPTDAQRQAVAIERAGKKIGEGLKAVADAIDRLAAKLPEPNPTPLAPTDEDTSAPPTYRESPLGPGEHRSEADAE